MEEVNNAKCKMQNAKLDTKKLVLFFTNGVSLELWERKGMLERELKIYKELSKYFEKIYFITYGKNDGNFNNDLSKYNIKVLPKKGWFPNILYSVFCVLYYGKELKKSDYFKTNQMLGSWSAVISKFVYKKKLIVRTGYTLSIFSKKVSKIKYLLSKIIEWISTRYCDLLVVATESEKEYFSKFEDKVRVVPNYVDTELFKPMLELKNKEPETILLFVGRFNPQKNLKDLFYALAGVEGVKLQMVGSGPQEKELKQISENSEIGVEFLSNQPHDKLPELINYADIFILPSLYEGNPKLLLEAMACGVAVLTTKVEGIKNIIEHGNNGYLVNTDSDSLRQGILSLRNNEPLQEKIGRAAREYIIKNNSLNRIIELELESYG